MYNEEISVYEGCERTLFNQNASTKQSYGKQKHMKKGIRRRGIKNKIVQ